MEKPKSAIEAAREYGVDIEQLRWFRQLTPAERLRHVESMLEFTLKVRTSIQRKKEKAKRDRENQLHGSNAPAGPGSGEHGGDWRRGDDRALG